VARNESRMSASDSPIRFSKAVCMREYRGKNPAGRPSFYITIPRDIALFMRLQAGELLEVTVRRMLRQKEGPEAFPPPGSHLNIGSAPIQEEDPNE
jgi:hypothetical protein